MKHSICIAVMIFVASMVASPDSLAQSGATCTSGGSQSSFRMMQRNQMDKLPQSPAPNAGQSTDWLAIEMESRPVYGRQLMSQRELKRYIKKLDKYADRPEKQAEVIQRHRQKMLSRAEKQGIDPELLEPEVQVETHTAGP